MKKYNLSEIMKNAWKLVKEIGLTISEGLKRAWAEVKNMEKDIIETLKANLEYMAYNCKYINAGIERTVSVKPWEKDGKKRTYLAINCYTAAGRGKGSYKCGYVDIVTGEYVVTKYDDVDALNKEYIG